MQSERKYQKLLKRDKNGKPGPKPKKIEAVLMDYTDLNTKFSYAIILINDLKLNKVLISNHLDILPSQFTHKQGGYRNAVFTYTEKEKVLDYLTAIGMKLINVGSPITL